jgi:large subunit ribosomal protein L7/L12
MKITINQFIQIKDLAEQIVALNMTEVAELAEILKVKLKLEGVPMGMPMYAAPPAGAPAGGAASAAGGGAPAAAEKKEEKKEKTEFTLKLDSFNAADKLKVCFLWILLYPHSMILGESIQVIKEIRAITGLGLKESKDLVEGAPKVVKEGVSKEDAEKFKKLIEEAGGKISIS